MKKNFIHLFILFFVCTLTFAQKPRESQLNLGISGVYTYIDPDKIYRDFQEPYSTEIEFLYNRYFSGRKYIGFMIEGYFHPGNTSSPENIIHPGWDTAFMSGSVNSAGAGIGISWLKPIHGNFALGIGQTMGAGYTTFPTVSYVTYDETGEEEIRFNYETNRRFTGIYSANVRAVWFFKNNFFIGLRGSARLELTDVEATSGDSDHIFYVGHNTFYYILSLDLGIRLNAEESK